MGIIGIKIVFGIINGAIYDALVDLRIILRHNWRMKSLTSLANEIKAARIAKKLSQQDLARAAGISRRTYQRFESGDPGTSIDTLFRTLIALGLTLKTSATVRPTLEELAELYGNDA